MSTTLVSLRGRTTSSSASLSMTCSRGFTIQVASSTEGRSATRKETPPTATGEP